MKKEPSDSSEKSSRGATNKELWWDLLDPPLTYTFIAALLTLSFVLANRSSLSDEIARPLIEDMQDTAVFFLIIVIILSALVIPLVFHFRRGFDLTDEGDLKNWQKFSGHLTVPALIAMAMFGLAAVFTMTDSHTYQQPTPYLIEALVNCAGPLALYFTTEMILVVGIGSSHPSSQRGSQIEREVFRAWTSARDKLTPSALLYSILWVIVIIRIELTSSGALWLWFLCAPLLLTLFPSFFADSTLKRIEHQSRYDKKIIAAASTSLLITLLLIAIPCLYLLFANSTANPTRYHLIQAFTWVVALYIGRTLLRFTRHYREVKKQL